MRRPEHALFSIDHEWVVVDGSIATIGISHFAADSLGDVVYIDPPKPGAKVTRDQVCGEVESTKSVSELLSPVTGTVTDVNEAAVADPALVNADPYGDGWLFRVTLDGQPTGLMNAQAYATHIGEAAS
jgi:glycine cleavage system H protein